MKKETTAAGGIWIFPQKKHRMLSIPKLMPPISNYRNRKKTKSWKSKSGSVIVVRKNRYSSGNSQRLKEKFLYLGTGKNFMYNFSLRAEELNISQSKKQYFRADGDKWITSESVTTSLLPLICFAVFT